MEKTILLVDDEVETRDMLARIISRKGLKVFTAGTGHKAIELYKTHKPTCVFLDVKLPDIQGPEVLEKLKQIDQRAKVYFITGLNDDDYNLQQKAKELGAEGYLGKPMLVEDLFSIIDSL
jgi:CheY-like chemotaxis protein